VDRARLTGPYQPQFAFNNQAKEHIMNRNITRIVAIAATLAMGT